MPENLRHAKFDNLTKKHHTTICHAHKKARQIDEWWKWKSMV